MSFQDSRVGFYFWIIGLWLQYVQGAITEGPSTAVALPGQDVEFVCDVTNGPPLWRVNGDLYSLNQLLDGMLAGHNASGNNIVVTNIVLGDSRNGSEYRCVLQQLPPTPDIESDPAFLYVAGTPHEVFGVMIDLDSTTITHSTNLTLTLIWEEPFNNFDLIINYTISCTGHPSCPEDITTPDNTTRYIIPNLLPGTNYTFTVVATNSLGSGNAGTLMLTSPSIPGEVTGVDVTCLPAELYNNCTVTWNPVTMGNGPLEQPLTYQVYYNGTTRDVDNITTSLTFAFSPLPVGIFRDNIHLIVTAVNRFISGTPSNAATASVYGSSVTSFTHISSNRTGDNKYSATFNCTIHPDSDVEFCSVEATASQRATQQGTGSVINGLAEVTVASLQCAVTYNITARGQMSSSQSFEGFSISTTTTITCTGSAMGTITGSNMMMMMMMMITAVAIAAMFI